MTWSVLVFAGTAAVASARVAEPSRPRDTIGAPRFPGSTRPVASRGEAPAVSVTPAQSVAARPAPRRDVPDPPDARGIEVAIGYGQFLDDSSPGEGRPWLLDLSFTLVIPVWRPADWLRIEAAPGVSFAYGRTPAGGERRDRVLGTFEIGPRLLFGRRGGVSLAAFWPATLIADSDGAEPSLDGWGVRAGLFVHRRVALVGEYRRVDREGESLRSIQAALTWWVD